MNIRYVQFAKLRNLFEPRKPRNPLVRIALGLLGIAILAVLVVGGVFIGAVVGIAYLLLEKKRGVI